MRCVNQCGRVGVVAGQRGVEEEGSLDEPAHLAPGSTEGKVLIAWVDEQFGLVGPDRGDQFAGSFDVAVECEELVVCPAAPGEPFPTTRPFTGARSANET